ADPRNDAGNLPNTELEYRREVENSLAAKAEEMLSQLLGPGHAIVRVTADINFRKVKERRESFSPEERVARKEKVTNSKTTGPVPTARGVAGATPNTTLPAGPSAGGAGESKTTDETTETEYD